MLASLPAPKVLDRPSWPPDYTSVYAWRQSQLERMLADRKLLFGAFHYYADRPVEFICHWCDLYEPRNAQLDLPAFLPFIMFKRQAECIQFLRECLAEQEDGLIDKSREQGMTWIGVAFSVWMWRFMPGSSVGWGSRKAELVDKIGVPDTIFEKIRQMIRSLPKVFLPVTWDEKTCATHMRIINRDNGASITGEGGDSIGRGGRKTIYFKDESAHYEHAEAIEASLMSNTRVQIDISTHNGVGTVFDRKRNSGTEWSPGHDPIPHRKLRVFVFDWRDHPTKTQEWHDLEQQSAEEKGLSHIFAQEVDRDPTASLQGIIIPGIYVRAAIDAHSKLGFGEPGNWNAALDVADEGGDLNALAARKGIVLKINQAWGEGDTGQTTIRALKLLEPIYTQTPMTLWYDSIGVGSGVKAETNRLIRERLLDPKRIRIEKWDAGGSVEDPEARVIPGNTQSPTNEDQYCNIKAQGWDSLRVRFYKTWRYVTKGIKYPYDELISLPSTLPHLDQLCRELSQPCWTYDSAMRMKVDKKPDGARSPNRADAVMMCYFPLKRGVIVSDAALELSRHPVR